VVDVVAAAVSVAEVADEERVVADRGQLAGRGIADQAGADRVVDAARGEVGEREGGAARAHGTSLEAAQSGRAESAEEITLRQGQRRLVVDVLEVAGIDAVPRILADRRGREPGVEVADLVQRMRVAEARAHDEGRALEEPLRRAEVVARLAFVGGEVRAAAEPG